MSNASNESIQETHYNPQGPNELLWGYAEKKKKKMDVHCELLWAEVKKIKLFK